MSNITLVQDIIYQWAMGKIAEWEDFSHSEGNFIEIPRMDRIDEGI